MAEGLANPRGLAIGHDGVVYVAEAGSGGGECFTPEPEDPEFEICVGTTGAITRVAGDDQAQVVTGLPSYADPTGEAAVGPHDVTTWGRGRFHVAIGLFAPTEARDLLAGALPGPGALFGQVVRVRHDGAVRPAADLTAFEADNDPDGQGTESNPYGLLDEHGPRLAVDASGNTLLQYGPAGGVELVAVFPNQDVEFPPGSGEVISAQSVPTAVAKGPDGAYYVSELTGFPFPVGGARIWRVVPGEEPTVHLDGFTSVIDLAFDRHGNLYVLEFVANGLLAAEEEGDFDGALIRVTPDGERETVREGEGLIVPGGVAVARNGDIFVTNNSISPDGGQLVRLP